MVKRADDGTEEIVYYGITNKATRRIGEHVYDGKDFDFMKPLTDSDLTHDAVRTLEAGLIRQRLQSQLQRTDGFDSVEGALRSAGLRNKNRGRIPENWLADENGEILQEVWDLLKSDLPAIKP